MSTPLPLPSLADADRWVATHLAGLFSGQPSRSARFEGGQTAADAALESLDVVGYASRRNQVLPRATRGASGLSPYIRHGLLQLAQVWDAVAGGPARDVAKFRDELLWQEYARHLYARIGVASQRPLRYSAPPAATSSEPWPTTMACVSAMVEELEGDGYLVNQARMWLASQWTVRSGADWRAGEDVFFTHLLDGARAANRLGWQWTTGQQTGRAYGFSRRQVRQRAPQLCAQCPLAQDCPIEEWPADPPLQPIAADPLLSRDFDLETTSGPMAPLISREPDAVWITAESLGDADPALRAHPDLPAVFAFDEPLLGRLQLSGKRLVFLAQCLAELGTRRELRIFRGSPVAVVGDLAPAVTFAPVPGFRRIASKVDIAAVHPWPWLRLPHSGKVQSFSAWRKGLEAAHRDLDPSAESAQ